MTATVTKLRTAAKPKTIRAAGTKRSPSARTIAKDNRATQAGLAYAAIGLAGMALSLAHQAHGVAASTTANGWEAWAMAVEVDLGFIAAKLTPYLCRSDVEREAVDRYAGPLSIAALILCAWFNSAGFAGFAPSGYIRSALCVVLGCAVPGIMFALSQMAAILILKRKG